MESTDGADIRVQFITKQTKYVITDTPIAVPGHVRRSHLSQMINHLLNSTTPKPFDFLINGEFIRTSLQQFLEEHSISTEELIEVEYVEAMTPPETSEQAQHDDWISSIAGHKSSGYVATGVFDRKVYIWNGTAELQATIAGHEGVVRAVAWGKAERDEDRAQAHLTLFSGSHDETIRKWKFDVASRAAECAFIYRGHVSSVSSVAVQPSGYMMCSGSWDRTVRVWATAAAEDDEHDEPTDAAKRRKVGQTPTGPFVKRPLGSFHGSTAAVKSVVWPTKDTIFSAGEDHAIRVWDAETGQNKQTMAGSKVISSIHVSSDKALIASAEFDAAVRIYDPKSESKVIRTALLSHQLPVNSVAWSPSNPTQLASGSLDANSRQNLKVWDIRSPRIPMFSIEAHNDKIFAVSWDTPDLILSGGAESQLKYNRLKAATDDTAAV
eukprot:m.173793 g.173793  ORF g.173793 m.173793 type:complete len:438 (-) comp53278_c0_seq1:87-1400(-)